MHKLALLFDENIGTLVISKLRAQGHDIKSILESKPGLKDEAVLAWAVQEQRVLVTLDKDFGRLVFLNSNKHVGVIFLRLRIESAANIFKVLKSVLENYGDKVSGRFITASEDRVRLQG